MTGIDYHGWIWVEVSEADIERAQAIRRERDARGYRNFYDPTGKDAPWVGDLGEVIFDPWLRRQGARATWLLDAPIGRPDFVLERKGIRVDVKAVKRNGPPRHDYTAGVTTNQKSAEVDHYFFLSYDMPARVMWLLGGLERECFMAEARHYKGGEWVHANYQIREGHQLSNMGVTMLIRPLDWLAVVAGAPELVA